MNFSLLQWDKELYGCLMEMKEKGIPVPKDVAFDYEEIAEMADKAVEDGVRDPESKIFEALAAMSRYGMSHQGAKETMKRMCRICALDYEVRGDEPGWKPVHERLAGGESAVEILKSLQ